MKDEEIRAALAGLQPPEDLFWQMARQGDWQKREPVMVFKKISREEARCSDRKIGMEHTHGGDS